MLDRLRIRLEAHRDEANHHRAYEIQVDRDLFSAWTVSIRFARVGTHGHRLRACAVSEEEARRIIGRYLARRLSAPRRIGCAYRLREVTASDSLNMLPWLGVLCRFVEDDSRTRRPAPTSIGVRPRRRGRTEPAALPLLEAAGISPSDLPGAEVIDLAAERRRRDLSRLEQAIHGVRDEILTVYGAAPEPSETSDLASALAGLADRLLDLVERTDGSG
ncbi:WGR domain-containing protein [Rhodospirillaceae bacterium SYSU D60014]|jgi:hypothetical protein|uniref:WGR domain-containing protein n=1 Tax=Virgifigura deserti TaxID=2268457 RepID=UPI000E66150E